MHNTQSACNDTLRLCVLNSYTMRSFQAQAYVALRKPYLVNDLFMQDILLDRRQVYKKLQVSRRFAWPQCREG